jgi:transcriptional regulator with XRE-family HTH domain
MAHDESIDFQQLLSEIRTQTGWSITRISRELGLPQPSVSRWSRGEQPMSQAGFKIHALHQKVMQDDPNE